MSKKGRISKKVETKVREYFEKAKNDNQPNTGRTKNDSGQPQANK